MPDGSIPLLVSLFVLIAFSAFFSATETAYTSASRIRLKSLATGGNRRAEKVLALCETSVSKMMKYFELDEDETSGSTTVSGWITEKLGDFPEEGKKLRWQNKIEIEVLKTDKNTIRSLKVVKL